MASERTRTAALIGAAIGSLIAANASAQVHPEWLPITGAKLEPPKA